MMLGDMQSKIVGRKEVEFRCLMMTAGLSSGF